MENDQKSEKKLEQFAKGLESEFQNFGEKDEKSTKKDAGDTPDLSTNDGWTIRNILDCFGVSDWQALLALSDKKIYEIALKNYPAEVRKACGNYSGVNGAMANFRAKTIEKLMKKYSYDIDFVVSDEIACGIAMGLSVASIFTQARMTANAIQSDLDVLNKKQEVKNDH